MKEQKKLNVAIAGQNYVLATDENEETLVKAVSLVDSSMNSILSSDQQSSATQAAILSAIRFAHDVVKSEQTELQREEKIKELMGMLS